MVVIKNDLDTMYKKFSNGGNITLWCDGRYTSTEGVLKRKLDLDSQSYWQGKEAEAESTYSLRLWARMISGQLLYVSRARRRA